MHLLLDLLFPPHCSLCGTARNLLPDISLCRPCSDDLLHNTDACSLCAAPLSTEGVPPTIDICAQCIQKKPRYDQLWSPFRYAQPLESMIQQLKFNARLNFAPLLSTLMIHRLPPDFYTQTPPDAVIPMPLHPHRLKQRGFNQSLLLLKPLAKQLKLPVDTESCRRINNTEHQTGKNAQQRQKNIKGAFTFENKNSYQHVVIFDDVVTTGSTVSELSKTIKQAGVGRVDVWCLARA
ncbi:MAG TPA: ComF family protein [Gammaproteobacteria bacterium]|nr:ComF family protein [Gammaproteobacteria bacterium]